MPMTIVTIVWYVCTAVKQVFHTTYDPAIISQGATAVRERLVRGRPWSKNPKKCHFFARVKPLKV